MWRPSSYWAAAESGGLSSDVGSRWKFFTSHAAPAVISVRRTVALRFSQSGYSCRDHHTESRDLVSNTGSVLLGSDTRRTKTNAKVHGRGDYP